MNFPYQNNSLYYIKNQNSEVNYILNGYKNRNPDLFLETIRSDALKLRFNNHLRLFSSFK